MATGTNTNRPQNGPCFKSMYAPAAKNSQVYHVILHYVGFSWRHEQRRRQLL